MAYSNFTLGQVRKAFELETVRKWGIFADIAPVEPSALLTAVLERNMPFALAMGTEKAKSELIVSEVLVELCIHFDNSVSLFSGIDFNVDASEELTGVCDFLVSLSPEAFELEAPVIALVAAKNSDVKLGVAQCAAEMVAAQRFNAEQGNSIPRVYGAITSGTDWLFLKLVDKTLHIDMRIYTLERCDRLLGILASMVKQQA